MKSQTHCCCRDLRGHGVHADFIHAEHTDAEREAAIDGFRAGHTWLLIATDLVGRGMDFLGITTVLNYDFPASTHDYIHRVGRTGRAGRPGKALHPVQIQPPASAFMLHKSNLTFSRL